MVMLEKYLTEKHELGDRIRVMREFRHMKQQELADALGVALTSISDIECNKRFPRTPLLINIAKYFGVSTDYLLGVTSEIEGKSKKLEELMQLAIAANWDGDLTDFLSWRINQTISKTSIKNPKRNDRDFEEKSKLLSEFLETYNAETLCRMIKLSESFREIIIDQINRFYLLLQNEMQKKST